MEKNTPRSRSSSRFSMPVRRNLPRGCRHAARPATRRGRTGGYRGEPFRLPNGRAGGQRAEARVCRRDRAGAHPGVAAGGFPGESAQRHPAGRKGLHAAQRQRPAAADAGDEGWKTLPRRHLVRRDFRDQGREISGVALGGRHRRRARHCGARSSRAGGWAGPSTIRFSTASSTR